MPIRDAEKLKAKNRKYYEAHKHERKPITQDMSEEEKSRYIYRRKNMYAKHSKAIAAKRKLERPAKKEKIALQRQQQRLQHPWKNLFYGCRDRALKRGLEFNLTDDWAKTRWTGYCELSGIPFIIGPKTPAEKSYAPSIDKIDPCKGYTQDNCRFILFSLNTFKWSGNDSQMLEIARIFIEYQKTRSVAKSLKIIENPATIDGDYWAIAC